MTEIAVGSVVLILLVLLLTVGLLAAHRRLVPQGGVAVTVNETSVLGARPGDRLLSVLHGAGIGIPAGCGGNGTCGLCRVTVTGEGAGEPQATERGVLSAAERRQQVRLACQVTVRGPVSVTVPSDALDAERLVCPVVSNRMLAPLIRELVVALPKDHDFRFRAGAFMQLTAPPYELDFTDIEVPDSFSEAWKIAGWDTLSARSTRPVTRAYSIACRPEDVAAGRLIFNIRLAVPPAGREGEVPPGAVSSYLFSLQPGDSIGVAGPYGDFHVQPTHREMIFIGGGVGMAPLRAMIHEQIGQGTQRKMSYFYGARTRADLFYTEEFEALARRDGTFHWTPALSDPAPGDRWTGKTGFIHQIVADRMRDHPAPEDCEYYLCGPPVMISAVLTMLERLGVERETIFNDDFGA
ncbi:NADH:ubiquinone reductase (Na(+)-transporting) subunit F [Tropicimonas isoalkanivorans]|uniref:Na(+)-translocating NADH-quinone reductase subunit F n=1 Tax=Tropicimonas isoalkanivorans TaxID=441112 RepID=A0A1I1QYI2_9RHOB|nr:NADH:ubiquinone reductase (Na(+)-transporting) subunit F [Tropicimonas isoalkanivorans]SFD27052.1 Na+-transporting NADH:ubiquinone oxidoreductase subunit F [Tropicimonas isoalkanivorans]